MHSHNTHTHIRELSHTLFPLLHTLSPPLQFLKKLIKENYFLFSVFWVHFYLGSMRWSQHQKSLVKILMTCLQKHVWDPCVCLHFEPVPRDSHGYSAVYTVAWVFRKLSRVTTLWISTILEWWVGAWAWFAPCKCSTPPQQLKQVLTALEHESCEARGSWRWGEHYYSL